MDEPAFASYLQSVIPEANELRVENAFRILGGISRETWSLDAVWREGGEERRRGLIFRLDPVRSLLADRSDVEYQIYRALSEHTDLPIPQALWFEGTGEWLGRVFFVTQRIDGCESSPQALNQEPYVNHLDRFGRRFIELHGELTRFDWRKAELPALGEPPEFDECWSRELDYWERVINDNRYSAQPTVRAGIDWLRRNPPPPAQRICVLNGDYRTGNQLYDREGTIHGWLDWELGHLGDPLEDLAYCFLPMWRWGTDKVGGVIAQDEAIRIWEETSGLRADPDALRWWGIFQHVKVQGIWQGAVRAFGSGESREMTYGMIATGLQGSEDQNLLSALGWAR